LRLITSAKPETVLVPATPDKRLLLATGPPQYRAANAVEQMLSRLPGLSRLGHDKADRPFIVVDAASGRETLRGDGCVCSCSPDGRYLVTMAANGMLQLWDIPPARPLSTFLPWALVWSAAWGLVLWWRVLRRVHARNVAAASTQAASNES
jgi:WD40 repeat protein